MPTESRRGAEPVDPVLGAVLRQVHGGGQDQQRQAAERQVDVERPAPGEVVGDEAADQRAGDHRDRHDAGDHALVAAPLAGRHQVTDDRHHADHQAAGAEALHGAEADQLDHAVAGPPSIAEPAMPQSAEPTRKITIEVRKTALRPYRSPSLPQIGVETVVPSTYAVTTQVKWSSAAELADDPRQRGADDHVVEHREHHRDHETAEHDPDVGSRRRPGGVLVIGKLPRKMCDVLTCRPASHLTSRTVSWIAKSRQARLGGYG